MVDDRGEELPLVHGGQQEGHRIPPLPGQGPGLLSAVDIVHPGLGVPLQILIQEVVQRPRFGEGRAVEQGELPLSLLIDEGDALGDRPDPWVDLPAAEGVRVMPAHGVQQPFRLHAEDHPVDGLELQGLVVEVHQLAQGESGGKAGPLLGGGEPLAPLVASLRGG